ncbi:MAG TPA: 30S ribosomal protein S2, partial [Alcanivorax sp.]|nr:30S ribosomal protein S2 [Alcanivorax sp.]HCQ36017.1 30S ribosomal protein S2 [Alcanivorax sp.]
AIMEGREYAQTQSGGDSEFVEVEDAEGEKAEG